MSKDKMGERKTNLFLAGAMKAGTTSFVSLLETHPDIYVPPVKEPNYFLNELPEFLFEPSRFFTTDGYLENDFPKDRHAARFTNASQYSKLYSLATDSKYLLDASTAYLSAAECPKMIADYNPDSKIIILLRDPLERMLSHYQMSVGLSRENRSFEEIAKEEISEYKAGDLNWYSYLNMSCYEKSIKRFRSHFDTHVIRLEELRSEPESVLQGLTDFLEVAPFGKMELPHSNPTRQLKYQKLFYALKRLGLKDYFSKWFGAGFKQKVFRAVSNEGKQEILLSPETEEELRTIFEKESSAWLS